MPTYEIISTGSKGNAVIINGSILVDAGVPYKALRHRVGALRLALLTHVHTDHFNAATVRRLAKERPALRFGCPSWMIDKLLDSGVSKYNIDIYTPLVANHYHDGLCVEMFPVPHNVDNCGYRLHIGGESVLYATDTASMSGIEARAYDLYMLEANYGEVEITERIRSKQEAGEYCHEWDVLRNHLSREKAEDWIYSQAGPNSRYVFLHGHGNSEETA